MLLFFLLLLLAAPAAAQVRIKDVTSVQGVRSNQLIGYGLVVGLNGTGDSLRNSTFTEQSILSMLDRMGVNVRDNRPRTKNIAAVMVTAELPPFIGKGSRIDVTVSSLGDASSLAGGSLVLTPLIGPDHQVYAVAQGPVAVSGFSAAGAAEKVTQGVPTAGRIPNGALIEQEVPAALGAGDAISLELRNPDFATAVRVTDVINAYSERRFGRKVAQEKDLRTVSLDKPRNIGAARFIAELGELTVQVDTPARVVIDERTGTIVIGRAVRVSTVAVAHGNLTVRVTETPKVSQPSPLSKTGETVVTPQTEVETDEPGANLATVKGTDLHTLVRGLNKIGLKPHGIIAILQAIKSAGALQAELVVQ